MKAIDTSPGIASRAESAADDAPLFAFLDAEFDGVPGLAVEYPLLVGPTNRTRRWVIREDQRFTAHAAWIPLTLISGEEQLRAAGFDRTAITRIDFRDPEAEGVRPIAPVYLNRVDFLPRELIT